MVWDIPMTSAALSTLPLTDHGLHQDHLVMELISYIEYSQSYFTVDNCHGWNRAGIHCAHELMDNQKGFDVMYKAESKMEG